MCKECNDTVAPVTTHQRVISAEEDFKNQVNGVICSVCAGQLLSPATPVIAQWARERSGHGGRDGGDARPTTQQD